MIEKTRPISWIKAARKDFESFPMPVQKEANRSLTVAAEGRKADNVYPPHFKFRHSPLTDDLESIGQ